MVKNSSLKKFLIALGALATVLVAMPSQAYERYCPPPYYRAYAGHGGYYYDRWQRPYRGYDRRYGYDNDRRGDDHGRRDDHDRDDGADRRHDRAHSWH
ncbi:MAG: hypothetical protein M0P19_11770 [Nevskia sp.]|jgi:hypothetical protein|nr:hypothetical protein [Nevskia sp.]MCK9383248.1 hypothetical protein [Nevskia sp.]